MESLGKLLLRVAVGGLLLMHGIDKIQNHEETIKWLEGLLEAKGLPTFLAWGAFVGEVVAPALLIVGLFARLAGLVVAAQMVAALYLGHAGQSITDLKDKGGLLWELPLLYLVGGLCVALLGPGRFSIREGGRSAPLSNPYASRSTKSP
jgi:putative oxidoreductase